MNVSVTISPSCYAGVSLAYRGGVVPFGFLLENGSIVSKSMYPRLFEAIGYTYGGAGDNFQLPDSRGRVDIGAGQGSGLSNRTLGQIGGAETHQLTEAQLPSHTHAQNPHTHRLWGSTYSASSDGIGLASASTRTVGGYSAGDGAQYKLTNVAGQNFVEPSTTTNGQSGGNAAHNNMQPFLVATKMIKY